MFAISPKSHLTHPNDVGQNNDETNTANFVGSRSRCYRIPHAELFDLATRQNDVLFDCSVAAYCRGHRFFCRASIHSTVPSVLEDRATTLTFCLIMACSFAGFWAISEELYINFFSRPSSDMPGIERHIYPGNSGMGFARGFHELHRSLRDAVVSAAILAILWTPMSFGLFVIVEKRKRTAIR